MAATRTTQSASKVAIPQLEWNQIRPAPVVLVSGTESFLARRSIRLLRDLLKAEDPSLEVTQLEADSYAPGSLVTLASPSLFNEPRFVWIENVEKCSDAFLTEALEYLASPAEGATVVLRHGGGVRGKKLLDALRSSSDTVVEVVCAELKKDADKVAFARAEFAHAKRRVRPDALQALVSAFSGDLAELAAACTQLMADTTGDITEEVITRYYGGRAEVTTFAVADFAIAGNYQQALLGLRQTLANGTPALLVVAAIAMKLRTMAKVSSTRVSGSAMAKSFGLAPWQIDRARRDLRGWDGPGLGRCIQLAAETDAITKGAPGDPEFAVERLVRVVAQRGRIPQS